MGIAPRMRPPPKLTHPHYPLREAVGGVLRSLNERGGRPATLGLARRPLTPALSRRERGPENSLSLRERAGVRVPGIRPRRRSTIVGHRQAVRVGYIACFVVQ